MSIWQKVRYQVEFAFAATSLALTVGCTTPNTLAQTFAESSQKSPAPNSETALIFLVDGLSVDALVRARTNRVTPNVDNFFQLAARPQLAPAQVDSGHHGFQLARASFPSLTYPNIVSILTGESVGRHGISGNHLAIQGGSTLDFEDFRSWDELNERIREQTIFHELTRRHLSSVSLSYPFSRGATAHLETNLPVGFNYANQDYSEIDKQTLLALEQVLELTSKERWPRFIFVHLIAVDAFEHLYGPNDPRIQDSIQLMDERLKATFQLLSNASAEGHKVRAVLTADHGFTSITHQIDISAISKRIRSDDNFVADNRMASIFLSSRSADHALSLAHSLESVPHLEWIIRRTKTGLELKRRSGESALIESRPGACALTKTRFRFTWRDGVSTAARDGVSTSPVTDADFFCAESFDKASTTDNLNFIVPALTEFFSLANPPDIILVADDHSDFAGGYLGNHGGLTRGEMLVPLLTRGLDNANQDDGIQPTWGLLRLLQLK